MAAKMEMDTVASPRPGAQVRQLHNGAEDRPRHDPEARPSWEPTLQLVESAAKKIALYERCFTLLEEEARKTALLVEADKRRMMRRISELMTLLQQSEANHQQTLALLANSTQVCALQRTQLKALTQTLTETRGEVFQTTSHIKKLGLLVSRAELEGSSEASRASLLQTEAG
jgi:hypothetical protein